MSKLLINSEIGKLKKVMLHRPDIELEKICPDELREVLFDDIPWMSAMKKEHDGFRDVLEKNDVLVVYFKDYLKKILEKKEQKEEVIRSVLNTEVLYDSHTCDLLDEYLFSLDNETLAKTLISGLSTDSLTFKEESLSTYLPKQYMYYFKPLPNLYFMRDVGVTIGKGLALTVMKNPIRRRESLLLRYIYKYHPDFNNAPIFYDNLKEKMSLEGGDVLILSKETVMVGFSQRTGTPGIERLAKNLLFSKESQIKNVIALKIPHERAFMHTDTVLTMLDYDKFLIFPNIANQIEAVIIKRENDHLTFSKEESLKSALEKSLNINGINLIKSGGNNPVIAAREQWNDSTNTLAIAPGVVVTYNRNEISNEILDKNGIKVLSIEGSELVRGRGGPRCMSMPMIRENI